MLCHLKIKNYALIHELSIDFDAGFTAITGETGSGKSILLGALALILGKRADTQVLLDKSQKCIVEAQFDISNLDLQEFFALTDLDYSDRCIVRREINQQGNSRAFINDTPVQLSIMKELGDILMDIHSQHKTMSLNKTDFQLAVINSYAKLSAEVKQYEQQFSCYKKLKQQLTTLLEEEKKSKADLDYFQFLFNELEELKIDEHEQVLLEEEQDVLTHAEDIKSVLNQTIDMMHAGELNVLSRLKENTKLLGQIQNFHSDIAELLNRFSQSVIELQDITNEMSRLESRINGDPARLQTVSERLDQLYRLQQKHHVNSNAELLEKMQELSNKLEGITSLDEKIEATRHALEQAEQDCMKQAKQLSKKRLQAIPKLEQELTDTLHQLAMPDARIKIDHKLMAHISDSGLDEFSFLFNANKGHELQPIAKVASGGELSRIMLSIKSSISQKNLLPTIIFDEIDTGVSGNVATRIGQILLSMSNTMQVIAITHLPQIASKAQHHFSVSKKTINNNTISDIKKLKADERITEIATMLAGEKADTASVTATAKELLQN